MAKFDPYHRWLAIPPDEQPPNYYRLLGVKPFETDEDVISAAVDQRMMHLRSFQNGPHAADSQRLLNEVAQASRTLLDPDDRRRYDKQLRATAAGRKSGLGSATVFSDGGQLAGDLAGQVAKLADESSDLTLLVEDITVAPVQEVKLPGASTPKPEVSEPLPDLSADLYELDTPAPQPTAKKPPPASTRPAPTATATLTSRRAPLEPKRRQIHPAIWASVAGVAAIILLLAIAALFPALDVLGMFHDVAEQPPTAGGSPGPPAGNTVPTPQPDPSREKNKPAPKPKTGVNQKPLKENQGSDSTSKIKEPTPPAIEKQQPDEKVAKDPATPPTEAPAVKTQFKLPSHFELPPAKETAPVTLGSVPSDLVLTSVRLFSQAARLDEDEYFVADPEQTLEAPTKWRVFIARLNADDRARPALAEIHRDGEALRFRWLPDAAGEPKSAQLCNTMLQVDTGDVSRQIFLRKLETVEPLAVDLSQPTIRRELSLPNLPRADGLLLQIGNLAALPVAVKMADEVSEAGPSQTLVVVFPAPTKEQRPELRVAFELASEDKVVLTAKPILVTPQEQSHWSPDRLAAHKAASTKELDDARRKVKLKENELTMKRKEQQKLAKKLNTAKGIEKTRTENAKFDIEREIEVGLNARDELRKQADAWKQVIDKFPDLEKLTKTVAGSAKLEFRLFARTQDADIELARTPNFR